MIRDPGEATCSARSEVGSALGLRAHLRLLPCGFGAALNFGVVSDRPDDELRQVATMLQDRNIRGIDGFEINPSCPNIVLPDGSHHRTSDNPDLLLPMLQVGSSMREQGLVGSYGIRLAPFKNRRAVRPMVRLLKAAEPDFVSIFNTFPVDPKTKNVLEVPDGVGGRSGKGMAPAAEEQTRYFMEQKESECATFQVVGSNGVADAETMRRRLELGVDATSGTALFWTANHPTAKNKWAVAVDQLLRDYSLGVEHP